MAEVFQLRIALHENIVKPTIWRMVQMEADRSLLDLHLLIQAAMGWENGHLHAFYEPGSHTGYTDMLLMEGDPDFEDGAKVKLRDVLKKVGNKLIYEYDFGDSWQHTVRLQSVLPMPLGFQAGCTDGARNCPPEDCGGIYSYMDIVEAFQTPKSPAAKEYKEWLGESYKPEKFSVAEANKRYKSFASFNEAPIPGLNSQNTMDWFTAAFLQSPDLQKQLGRVSVIGKILALKITVVGTKPEISRVVQIESSMSLRNAMKVFRASFGWHDEYTEMGYYVTINGDKWGKNSLFGGWYTAEILKKIPSRLYDDSKIKLNEFLTETGTAVNCNMPLFAWKFRIKCEEILEKDKKNTRYPVCVQAKGSVPEQPTNFRSSEGFLETLTELSQQKTPNLNTINAGLEVFRKKKK